MYRRYNLTETISAPTKGLLLSCCLIASPCLDKKTTFTDNCNTYNVNIMPSKNPNSTIAMEIDCMMKLCEESDMPLISRPSEVAIKTCKNIVLPIVSNPDFRDYGIFPDENGGLDFQVRVNNEMAFVHINSDGEIYKIDMTSNGKIIKFPFPETYDDLSSASLISQWFSNPLMAC